MHVNVAVAEWYGFSSWIKKSGVKISRHAFNYLQPQKYAQKSTASPLDNWKIKGYLELGLQPQLKIVYCTVSVCKIVLVPTGLFLVMYCTIFTCG